MTVGRDDLSVQVLGTCHPISSGLLAAVEELEVVGTSIDHVHPGGSRRRRPDLIDQSAPDLRLAVITM